MGNGSMSRNAMELDSLSIPIDDLIKNQDYGASEETPVQEGEEQKNSVINFKTLFYIKRGSIFLGLIMLSIVSAKALAGLIFGPSKNMGTIVYHVSCGVDDANLLEFKLVIPFKDKEEKEVITQKLSSIKKTIQSKLGELTYLSLVKAKDLRGIKSVIAEIVCKLTDLSETNILLSDIHLS